MASLSPEDHLLIEKQLFGRLTGEEQQLFDRKKQESDFQKEWEYQKDMMMALKAEGRSELKSSLQQLERERFSFASRSIRPLYGWLSAAAAAILLLLVGYWLVPSQPPAELFAAYPNELYKIQRDEGAAPSPEQQAFYYYDLGDYKRAAELLTALRNDKSASPQHGLLESGEMAELAFYEGNAYLSAGNLEAAIPLLEDIQKSEFSRFNQQASWYLALAFYKGNQLDIATPLLESIANTDGHAFQSKAKDLLKWM